MKKVANNCGAIVRTMMTVFNSRWFKVSDLLVLCGEKAIPAPVFSSSLNYLQQRGLISVRKAGSGEVVEISCYAPAEVEAKLTAEGLRLLLLREDDGLSGIAN